MSRSVLSAKLMVVGSAMMRVVMREKGQIKSFVRGSGS